MDIHRCRFVDFEPSAINALAFTHKSGRAGRNQPLRLAIGRANGDIEIWNPLQGSWFHETTCTGGKERSVEGLAWIQDPDEKDETSGFIVYGRSRLFSIGYSSTVTEWDLITGLPLRHSSGNHSQVWCLAAQPKIRLGAKNADTIGLPQDLVVGCADGSLVRLSTRDDALAFNKFVARASKKNARALSLAFQTRDILAAGFADSSIRVYNIDNGNLLRTMTLGAGPSTGPKEKLVWSLECLKDGTIVSGDSSGEVRFWDGKTYSQQQRIQAHEADTLCLASSEDGKMVMSGGIDRKTILYTLSVDGQKRKWAQAAHDRHHKHDIKAMASFENSKMSLVVSGGLDATPMLIPLREHGKEYHHALPYTLQTPPITSCGRYILNWTDNDLTIWRVSTPNQIILPNAAYESTPNYRVAARIALKGDENITSASISAIGALLAVSTPAETKLFRLKSRPNGSLKVFKLETPQRLSKNGSKIVQFSPDGKWLLSIEMSNTVLLFRVLPHTNVTRVRFLASPPTILRRIRRSKATQNSFNGDWGSYDRKIIRATFSSDSRILAVSDLAGYIDTFILKGNGDLTSEAVAEIRKPESSNPPGQDSNTSGSDSGAEHSSGDEQNNTDSLTVLNFGQHWIRNPLGKSLPRTSSAPIIISFRPSLLSDSESSKSPPHNTHTLSNGSLRLPATRHRPDTYSNTVSSQPSVADRLLVITAKHEIQEFEILKGKLSDWSRRNPANGLPDSFKLQRERAMGCIWDVSRPNPTSNQNQISSIPRERIWVYGATWLCMFDLSQDLRAQNNLYPPTALPQVETEGPKLNGINPGSSTHQLSNKRKRNTSPSNNEAVSLNLALKKKTTGAGSKIPDQELGRGIGSRTIGKIDEEGAVSYINIDAAAEAQRALRSSSDDNNDDNDSEDIDDENLEQDLQRLRGRNHMNGSHHVDDTTSAAKETPEERPAFYLTTKYRPILGILPLTPQPNSIDSEEVVNISSSFDEEESGQRPLEVALIERPFWDLNLPPRFIGARDSRQ